MMTQWIVHSVLLVGWLVALTVFAWESEKISKNKGPSLLLLVYQMTNRCQCIPGKTILSDCMPAIL